MRRVHWLATWRGSTEKPITLHRPSHNGNPGIVENLILNGTALTDPLVYGFSTTPRDPETGLIYYGYRGASPVKAGQGI